MYSPYDDEDEFFLNQLNDNENGINNELFEKLLNKDLYESIIRYSQINNRIKTSEEKEEEEKEMNEMYKKIYYLENKTCDTYKNLNSSENNKFIQNKRGRKITKKDNKNAKIHDKYAEDNILRKIQVHYLSFLISFVNDILKSLNYKEKFIKLDYKFKSDIKKESVDKLKEKTLGDIILEKKSTKFTNNDGKRDIELYNKLNKEEVFKNIFSKKYLDIFRKIYYISKRTINLEEYGKKEEITLSPEVKMYDDFLKKNCLDEEYEIKLNECIKRNFLPNSKFIINKLIIH